MSSNQILLSAGVLIGAMTLLSSGQSFGAVAALSPVTGGSDRVTPATYRHRHVHRHAHAGYVAPRPVEGAAPAYYGAYGGAPVNGSPPNNEFDATRPYGGQAAITAPPGTDAYEEQQNQRRYFCDFSPSRC